MPSCFICGRTRNVKTKSANITFHRFPSKSCELQKWHEFIISNNRKLENITKNSLICSCHFKPESFIVHNKNRILQKHAVPTIIIARLKGAKAIFSEIKEEMFQPTSSIGGSSNLKMKTILIKDNSEFEHGILPLTDRKLDRSVANVSSDAVNSSTNTAEITDNSEPMNSTLRLVNNDLYQSLVNATPDTFKSFNSSIPTVKGKVKSAYLTASKTSGDDTPRRSFLKYGIRQLLNEIQIKNRKLKKLQETIQRRNKTIASMSETIKNLKNKNL